MNVRFALPLSDPKELIPLKNAGADEVYLGFLEEKWISLYGNHDSISRRQGAANLRTREQLRQTLSMAEGLGVSVDLALNGRYTSQQYDYLEEMAYQFADWGGRGLIMRDVGLMLRLRRSGLTGKYEIKEKYRNGTARKNKTGNTPRLTASLLAVTVNADGVRFFRDLGASRIVLPRFLAIREMKDIACRVPGMEYEVMVFGDKCPMIDGLCRSFHGQSYEAAELPGSVGSASEEKACLTEVEQECFFTFDTSCEAHHLCSSLCRHDDPCAACRMDELERAGIGIMKFGGRGTPLAYRLKALEFFEKVRNRQKIGPVSDEARVQKMYRETFGHDCCCYYR